MSKINVATQAEWLESRKALLQKEKELTWERERLAEMRRALPWVKVREDYLFQGDQGDVRLSQLFGDCSQLAVYHFMFGPDWEVGCKSCSWWIDNFTGIEAHLKAQDIAFVMVSKAGREKTAPFQARMGWDLTWVSAENNRFNEDMDVSFTDREDPSEPVTYNYHEIKFPADQAPGMSIFAKDEAGQVYHTYSTFARGLDILNGAYHIIDLTPKGRVEAHPMDWLRHHDGYGKDQAA